jgi:hypothetical protein
MCEVVSLANPHTLHLEKSKNSSLKENFSQANWKNLKLKE